MCVPIFGALGAVVSGIGAMAASNARAEEKEAEAKLHERQALLHRLEGSYAADREGEKISRAKGQIRAGYSANGIALDGSAEEVLRDTATEGAMDIAAIRTNAKLKSGTEQYKARVARVAARNERSAGGIGFLSSIIGGAAKLQGAWD